MHVASGVGALVLEREEGPRLMSEELGPHAVDWVGKEKRKDLRGSPRFAPTCL